MERKPSQTSQRSLLRDPPLPRFCPELPSNSKTKLDELWMVVWFSVGWLYWLASNHAANFGP
jgi:hypothetical protein